MDPVDDAVGTFSLKDTDVPIISCEAYMFDNADWVLRTEDGSNDFINWGNTSRSEVDVQIQDSRDSLYILKPTHPIAGGLTGKVKVYSTPYSLNFGIPSSDADIIASVEEDGSYPTLWVYEKGDKLSDGSTAPNMRIALFLGQAANPNANWSTDYSDLSNEGKNLLLNTVAYALGAGSQAGSLELSAARAGNKIQITWTDATAKLQSANAITGPWSPVNASSPHELDAPAGRQQFFRLTR